MHNVVRFRRGDGAAVPKSASSKGWRFRFDFDIPTVVRESFFFLQDIVFFITNELFFIFVFLFDLVSSPAVILSLLL